MMSICDSIVSRITYSNYAEKIINYLVPVWSGI